MKTNTNLKRTVIAAISGLMFVGLLTAGIFVIANQTVFQRTALAQQDDKSVPTQFERQFDCSNATLQGRYAVIGSGFVPNGPPSAPLVPFANMSLMIMDGAGNLFNKVTVSRNGQIVRNLDPGVYDVNPDCTGTMTINIPDPPFQLSFDLVVADLQGAAQGKEFYFIATSGGVVTHTAKRIQ